jgi:hypothetical protein
VVAALCSSSTSWEEDRLEDVGTQVDSAPSLAPPRTPLMDDQGMLPTRRDLPACSHTSPHLLCFALFASNAHPVTRQLYWPHKLHLATGVLFSRQRSPPCPRSAAKMLLPKLSVATLCRPPDSSIAAGAFSLTSSYCATRLRRPLLYEDGTPLVGESQIHGHTATASRSPGIHSSSVVRIVTITFVDTVSVSIQTNHSTHI